MARPHAAVKDDESFVDRRASERHELELKCILHIANAKYSVTMKDVSIYGMGICARGTEIEDGLEKNQLVSVEWRYGEVINAAIVWSFKGRYGLLLKPPLEKNHPLLIKARAESTK